MKRDVAKFATQCLTCQQVKADHEKLVGLLLPLDVPDWKWEHITIYFVSGLPSAYNRHDTVWVVMDRLTMSAQLIPIWLNYPMDKLSELYI